ncbi:hypothetical protein OS965_02440 [Streptomyces sp. H27-G5]|uniref:hypothetical protein n=1 Tax=Streptomyces sp. H27-G5 TaxID=2996698 RepID=UPI002271DCA1|nr:hypothetical protein [Streptomyces sp. H27-G5]MCY0917035.1 hypothetical protein [Streptomyces sp. H27-G5]
MTDSPQAPRAAGCESETAAELTRLRAELDRVQRRYTFDTAGLRARVTELEAESGDLREGIAKAIEQRGSNFLPSHPVWPYVPVFAEIARGVNVPPRSQPDEEPTAELSPGRQRFIQGVAEQAEATLWRRLGVTLQAGESESLVENIAAVIEQREPAFGGPVTDLPDPYGCTYCGDRKSHHGRQYHREVGVHSWVAPSDAEILARMQLRRELRTARLQEDQ